MSVVNCAAAQSRQIFAGTPSRRDTTQVLQDRGIGTNVHEGKRCVVGVQVLGARDDIRIGRSDNLKMHATRNPRRNNVIGKQYTTLNRSLNRHSHYLNPRDVIQFLEQTRSYRNNRPSTRSPITRLVIRKYLNPPIIIRRKRNHLIGVSRKSLRAQPNTVAR